MLSFYFVQTNFYLFHPLTRHGPLCVLVCWSTGGRLTGTRWSKEKSGKVCLSFTLSDGQVVGQLATEPPLVAFLLNCLQSLTILSCFFRSRSYIICGGFHLLLFLSPVLALVARLFIDFIFVVKVKHFPLFVMVRILLFLLALLSSVFNYFLVRSRSVI